MHILYFALSTSVCTSNIKHLHQLFTETYFGNQKCRGYKLLSLFRVKIWWMIPRIGRSASDVPMETQFLLLEAREESALEDEFSSDSEEPTTENTCYILFLPVLDGQFRATLQGTQANELQFCIESGQLVRSFTFCFASCAKERIEKEKEIMIYDF